MNNIVNLNSLDDEDEEFQTFLEGLKEDNDNAIFLVEKKDGTVVVGCNFTERRDLVYAIYNLQNLAQSIVRGEVDDE